MLRKPVRSPVTASILLLLRGRRLSSVELAEELGLHPSQVNAYLHYLKKRGVVAKDGDTWHLSEQGVRYVEERLNYLTRVSASVYGIKMNKEESRRINLDSASRIREIAREWLGEGPEDCMIIVDFLAFLYAERGKTYFEAGGERLEDALAQALEEWSSSSYVSPFRVAECLGELSRKGVVYVWRGRKVRLSRQLIEAVQRLAGVSPSASERPSHPSQ